MAQDERKAKVEQYYAEVLNGRNLDAVSDFFTDERIVKGIRRGCFAYFEAFPDLHIALDELIAEGDRVFVRSTMTGTHDGAYKGIPATGRHICRVC
jgi:predicted ester cyclase